VNLLPSVNVTVPDSHGKVAPTGPQVPTPVNAAVWLEFGDPARK